MKISKEKMSTAVFVLLLLAVPLIQISWGATEDITAKNMLPAFLSDVVGLDLTKYNMTNEDYSFSYPSYYGGEVKEERVSLDLTSNEGNISVKCRFFNGFNSSIFVYPPTEGSMFFKNQPATNALDESRNIMQRYKAFAENYGLETSHIDPALTLLNNATRASPSSDDSFTFNKITGFVPSVTTAGNVRQETTQRSITWIYTVNGDDIPRKALKIDFGPNKLHFVDTWNLYTIGSFSLISEDEAKSIGLNAAQNYNLTLVDANDTAYVVEKPGWSNRTSIALSMVPGQIYNRDPNDTFITGGNATRDPLGLYPQWQMIFYFSPSIGHITGIQVGVWGDTKEIAYISAIGYLGAFPGENPDTPSSTEPLSDAEPPPGDLEMYPTVPILPSLDNLEGDLTSTSTSATQPEDPTESESSNPSTMLLIGGTVATAIASAVVILKKRRN